MNYYFLLEDEKSFMKVLPYWLKYMGFQHERVADISDVCENSYVLQSGQGVTQLITKALFDTIDTLMNNPYKIDKLVVIVDAEDKTIEERKKEIYDRILKKYDTILFVFEIVIIVCNRCFETWLLGSCGIYPDIVEEDSFFFLYYKHYNVEKEDPENMGVPFNCDKTIAKYHFCYFHELMRYHRKRYSKKKPLIAMEKDFFENIVRRVNLTQHLNSFRDFFYFIKDQEIVKK